MPSFTDFNYLTINNTYKIIQNDNTTYGTLTDIKIVNGNHGRVYNASFNIDGNTVVFNLSIWSDIAINAV
jgi:hypothetical protein